MRFIKEAWNIVSGLVGLCALLVVTLVIVACGILSCLWNLITTGKIWK